MHLKLRPTEIMHASVKELQVEYLYEQKEYKRLKTFIDLCFDHNNNLSDACLYAQQELIMVIDQISNLKTELNKRNK